MIILAFGCKNSPFILSVVIKLHIIKFGAEKPELVSMLNFGLYVDLYFGADIVREAIELLSDVVTLLESGDFNLRNLSFYNSELKAFWFENRFRGLFWYPRLGWVPHVNNGTQSNRRYQNRPLSESEKESVKLNVFGLNLNPEKDVLSLEVKGVVDSLKTLDNSKCCVRQTTV
ncbi:hypothetical protein AVEN_162295-1 [Araneus ventricosus]|uniref:Uncharacterized protein n=1 Tax=Araneus ventricosus TaxID=182803 RepID=A0A4Y2SXM2_ARAVE|nr:hypothetical protein AVEN_162295-1 [Araneus ventricosus]